LWLEQPPVPQPGPGGLRFGCRSRHSSRASGGDHAKQGCDANRFAFLGHDFAEYTGRRRVDFERDLVSFKLDQRLIRLDGIARLLEPLADRGFGDAFAEGWNADFGGHL
jgi:hypothetical protein